MMKDRVVIFGGSNVDIIGESKKKINLSDANSGKIKTTYGGAGRNIAVNLALLDNDVTFFTGIGNDYLGSLMLKNLSDLGIKVLYPKPKTSSSLYMAINDGKGELFTSIYDSRAIDCLSLPFIRKDEFEIREREYLVMDSNLPNKLIGDLFHVFPDKKWCVECVSVDETSKLSKYLHSIWLLKGNFNELKELCCNKNSFNNEQVVSFLLQAGVKNIVITNRMNPVIVASKDGVESIPVLPLDKMVNSIGAGNALFAGIIDSIYRGKSVKEGVEFGVKLAALTMKTDEAVNEDIAKLTQKD